METKKEYEYSGSIINGFIAFIGVLVLMAIAFWCLIHSDETIVYALLGSLLFAMVILSFNGFIKLEPNEAKVLVFFGKYRGTFQKAGFYWVNPLLSKKNVSLRARNLNPEPIKVNDKAGNPILIGMVLVWKLEDTYKALFEIDSQSLASPAGPRGMNNTSAMLARAFENFVAVQSDAALRQVAGQYAYDNASTANELTLRSNAEEINNLLEKTLNERLAMAGIHIVEARINYLAYAPEIAAVMLRRQQADAIIAAREKIVEGAVGMVKIALDKLDEDGVIKLDDERKAAMVSNLLVVLCGEENAQPIVNSGSI